MCTTIPECSALNRTVQYLFLLSFISSHLLLLYNTVLCCVVLRILHFVHLGKYKICTGETGHAEAVQLLYDPSKVSATDLLEIFFKLHDPTTKNRQGNDVGPQYRY